MLQADLKSKDTTLIHTSFKTTNRSGFSTPNSLLQALGLAVGSSLCVLELLSRGSGLLVAMGSNLWGHKSTVPWGLGVLDVSEPLQPEVLDVSEPLQPEVLDVSEPLQPGVLDVSELLQPEVLGSLGTTQIITKHLHQSDLDIHVHMQMVSVPYTYLAAT